jgi:PAS domain S-box-containing protein
MGARELAVLQDLAPLFEHLPGVQFWIKDAQGRFLAANAAFCAHFGLKDFAGLRGKTDYDVSPLHLAREYVQDDQAVLSSGRPQAGKMELVRERDGRLHWYATTKVPLRDGHRKPWGTAGCARRLDAGEAGHPGIRGMREVVDHIQSGLGRRLPVAYLAKLAGISTAQFERRFKSVFRETPARYILRARMRAACQLLLHTDLSVGEVAKRAGFRDQSYFTKRFRAQLRIRPLEYRRKYAPR